MKNADPNDRMGYLYDEQQELCLPKVDCKTIGLETCTWEDPSTNIKHQVFGKEDLSGTSCTIKLYRN